MPRLVRRSIIDEAVIYIGRTDLEDALCDVVYAASCNDDDLRYLAERLEGLNRASPLEHARRIYRRLGDREQYLALRTSNMVHGVDYYDLAMFYAEAGETDHALVRFSRPSTRSPSKAIRTSDGYAQIRTGSTTNLV